MSALPPIADILGVNIDVRFVPKADISQFDEPDRFLLLNLIIAMAVLVADDNNFAAS
jgi:hypothetical protein